MDQFASFSGCKVSMSKSEAIHIDSLRNSDVFPFQDSGLRWRSNTFKTLGIHFSLNVNSLYGLNFVPKLRQIKQTLNCWKHRNLSQLLNPCCFPSFYIFFFFQCCALLIFQKLFFKKLNHLFYKFIWNGGNDGLNVIFFVMTMIMVVCGFLIHFYFSKLKNLFGLSNCLIPTTPVFGEKMKCPF